MYRSSCFLYHYEMNDIPRAAWKVRNQLQYLWYSLKKVSSTVKYIVQYMKLQVWNVQKSTVYEV